MKKNQESLIIDSHAVNKIITTIGFNNVMDELIVELESALSSFTKDETEIPIRSGFNYKKPFLGLVEWMPIMKKGEEVVIKVVGYHPENPVLFKIPTILSTISSYDAHTGHLNYLVDGVLLTALRTGASSAVASRMMAKKDSKVLGIIGCGAQSVPQIHAISRLFNIQEILIYDIDQLCMESMEDRIGPLNLGISPKICNVSDILEQSDILCTATSIEPEKGPLFDDFTTKPHLHINAVGADFPGKYELPLLLLEQAYVCPDFLDQAVLEGECQQLMASDIGPSWIELIHDEPLKEIYQSALSVFDSTGWALEDQVTANLFFKYAKELGLGTKMKIETYSPDEKNPYGVFAKYQTSISNSVKF
jgi:ornithine cyclodeaminase/alanine dehydrogenase-like protein (mu-crystallin family)